MSSDTMTKEYFIELAEFNIWANDIVLGWLNGISDSQWEQPVVSSFGSIAGTVLHLTGAEKAWYDRLESGGGDVQWLPSAFKGTREELTSLWKQASAGLKEFIGEFDEKRMREPLVFKRLSGEENRMPYYQVFAHVMNHSTYHRGQIVIMLRQVGFTDIGSTDLLGFYRTKN